MKMRLTKPSAAPGAWLIAGRSAAGAVLIVIAVSACTGGGSGSSVPSIFTPTAPTSGHASASGSRTPSPAGGASSTRKAGASTSPTAHPSSADSHASASASSKPSATTAPSSAPATHATAPVTHATAPVTHATAPVTHNSAPAYPTAAPETGGGGAAGLQDGLLFGLGGLAVFAGLGSLAYRRRLARKFGAGQRTPQTPADREPADH
jgi:hypothetical protein